jgi:aminopeptidase N
MKTKLAHVAGFLAAFLIIGEAPAGAQPKSPALAWAPALYAALPRVTEGLAGEVTRNVDALHMLSLNVRAEDLAALSARGFADLEGLTAAVRGVKAEAFADSVNIPLPRLENLSRSLSLFAPVVARLEEQGLTAVTFAKSDSGLAELGRALEAQARQVNARALDILNDCAAAKLGEDELQSYAQEVTELTDNSYPYLKDAVLDRLAKLDSKLHGRGEQSVSMALPASGY